jgi:hypothetical protein
MAIITLNNNSLSSVTSLPAGVGGKVLQVVSETTTSEFNTTSTSFSTFSSMNRTITAISANSKFMCILNAARLINPSDAANNDIQFTDGTNNSNYIRFYSGYDVTGAAFNPSITSIISGNHSAGASLTISVQGRTTAGTFIVGDTGTPSTMFVLEIE